MTVMVFASTSAVQSYYDKVVAGAKGLSGFENENVSLVNYQQYGSCYGYGQNYPNGVGGTATSICTKGNVFMMVHVSTTTSLLDAVTDMTYLTGAAYESAG